MEKEAETKIMKWRREIRRQEKQFHFGEIMSQTFIARWT